MNDEPQLEFMVDIDQCELWDKNPRAIMGDDYEDLKYKLKRLGQFKPSLAFQDLRKGKWIILGGNMRLVAMRELGFKRIRIAPQFPKNEAHKLELALADNDRSGMYDEDQLAELLHKHKRHIELKRYKIDLGKPISIESLAKRYGDVNTDKPEIELSRIYEIIIECESAEIQREIFDKLKADGMKVRRQTL